MINYGRQSISQEDIDEVVEVLKSDFLTQGPVTESFEDAISKKVGSKFAVATNSATSALHISCLALGLTNNDWLWTSPITFVASANCALYCGANIDFVDIDSKTFNISVLKLEKKLLSAKKDNKLPKIVVVVHMTGQSAEMEKIYKLSQKYGFSVIEDASHALGGKYQGKYIGSCQFSDITIFSFHPVKIITSAEGGMALTNSQEISKKLKVLRTHGITRDPNLMLKQNNEFWRYEQIDLGFNYRMSDLHAALGLSQLKRLNKFVEKRHYLANRYNKLLAKLPVTIPHQNRECYSSFHLYVILLDIEKINKTQSQIFDLMRAKGIGVNLHYIPLHTQPFYKSLGFKDSQFPKSMEYSSRAMSLPIYYDLTDEQQDIVIKALTKVLS